MYVRPVRALIDRTRFDSLLESAASGVPVLFGADPIGADGERGQLRHLAQAPLQLGEPGNAGERDPTVRRRGRRLAAC